jgi:hypothetical protein
MNLTGPGKRWALRLLSVTGPKNGGHGTPYDCAELFDADHDGDVDLGDFYLSNTCS